MVNEKSIRMQITMSESLVKKIEAYADSLAISRSSAISVLTSQALQIQENIGTLGALMDAYNKEQAKEQPKKQLEE